MSLALFNISLRKQNSLMIKSEIKKLRQNKPIENNILFFQPGYTITNVYGVRESNDIDLGLIALVQYMVRQ